MRLCGICKRGPRANDPAGPLFVPDNPFGIESGSYPLVCATCRFKFEPDKPDVYSVGPWPALNIPGTCDPQTYILNNSYCGICQCYAREDDVGRIGTIRIDAEDRWDGEDIEPGQYRACPECFAKWKPRIHRRWVRDGIRPPGTPLEALSDLMLS